MRREERERQLKKKRTITIVLIILVLAAGAAWGFCQYRINQTQLARAQQTKQVIDHQVLALQTQV